MTQTPHHSLLSTDACHPQARGIDPCGSLRMDSHGAETETESATLAVAELSLAPPTITDARPHSMGCRSDEEGKHATLTALHASAALEQVSASPHDGGSAPLTRSSAPAPSSSTTSSSSSRRSRLISREGFLQQVRRLSTSRRQNSSLSVAEEEMAVVVSRGSDCEGKRMNQSQDHVGDDEARNQNDDGLGDEAVENESLDGARSMEKNDVALAQGELFLANQHQADPLPPPGDPPGEEDSDSSRSKTMPNRLASIGTITLKPLCLSKHAAMWMFLDRIEDIAIRDVIVRDEDATYFVLDVYHYQEQYRIPTQRRTTASNKSVRHARPRHVEPASRIDKRYSNFTALRSRLWEIARKKHGGASSSFSSSRTSACFGVCKCCAGVTQYLRTSMNRPSWRMRFGIALEARKALLSQFILDLVLLVRDAPRDCAVVRGQWVHGAPVALERTVPGLLQQFLTPETGETFAR